MRVVIQRVDNASVTVNSQIVGEINKGFLVLLGVGSEDSEKDADYLVKKVCNMRIFSDENDKINLSLKDVNGELLIISQFTLFADCVKGNRPNFIQAGSPQLAEKLYLYFTEKCREQVKKVETGIFGEHMDVKLTNSGPFTIVLDSKVDGKC